MVFDNVRVGDRFKEKQTGRTFEVTDLTVMGFKYKMDQPYHALPARMGPSLVTEGELFINNPELEGHWDHAYEKLWRAPRQLNLPLEGE